MGPKVPMMDIGSAAAGISTARGDRRKTNTTPITSSTAMKSVRSVSPTEALTDSEWSIATPTWMLLGSRASMDGSTLRICLTVSTMLLPGSG